MRLCNPTQTRIGCIYLRVLRLVIFDLIRHRLVDGRNPRFSTSWTLPEFPGAITTRIREVPTCSNGQRSSEILRKSFRFPSGPPTCRMRQRCRRLSLSSAQDRPAGTNIRATTFRLALPTLSSTFSDLYSPVLPGPPLCSFKPMTKRVHSTITSFLQV